MALVDGNSADPAPAHPKRERRKEARPGELLAAALELFVEKGFAATRVEEVAARAGVSKGTLFLYFPTKDELLKAVVRENISGRFRELNQEFRHFEGSAADMLRKGLHLWWERVGATQASGISKLIMSEARNFPDMADFCQHEVIQPCQELICWILQRGIDRGEFRQVDLRYAAANTIGAMVFLMMMKHSLGPCLPQDQRLDPQRFIAAHVDTLLQGLCVRPRAVEAALPS